MQTNGIEYQHQSNVGKKTPVKNDTHLSGMKAITEYAQRGEATILKLIRDYGFPAHKLLGIWESDKLLIDEWRLKLLTETSR
ncbi:MAG: hypothetical protein V1844_09865 [Pseudomonadota bacterium]